MTERDAIVQSGPHTGKRVVVTETIEVNLAQEILVGDTVKVHDWPGWYEVVQVTGFHYFFCMMPHTVTKFGKQHTEMSKTYKLRSDLVAIRRKIPL